MDISNHTNTTVVRAFKTKDAQDASVAAAVDSSDRLFKSGISDNSDDFNVRGHKVIFGNCLHKVPGGYRMWNRYGTNEACGDSGIWNIPDACAVAAVRIGVCSDGCVAVAVEIRC